MKKLEEYNKKRDFKKTKEPVGKVKKSTCKKKKFIIQHHLATKDHYDFRLEYKGVYVSFAVPKGPSFNTKDKRLAIKVEDHPLSYGDFEGIIEKGNYGAGVVMLFDKGFYTYKGKIDFENGPIKFTLYGKRCKGDFSLIKMKDSNWLLIKEKDEFVGKMDIKNYKTSIKTGRTMKEIENSLGVNVTNPEKIIFAKEKITKGDIFNYYKLVSKRMMPFLMDRLISVIRCPNGKEKFYMKHLNSNSKNLGKKKVKSKEYYYIKNINDLLEEVQMNSYEFHIWGSPQNTINKPDILVFDLDPDEGLSLKKVRDGVKDLKEILDSFKLKSYLKTSGGKGYHIYVPLNTSSWSVTEKIAKDIADLMVLKFTNKYTTNIRKEKRKGKIFIDYFRNKLEATSSCPYSLRLKKGGAVSAPISWRELDKIGPSDITIKNIKERLKKKDPWADFFL